MFLLPGRFKLGDHSNFVFIVSIGKKIIQTFESDFIEIIHTVSVMLIN